MVKYSKEEIVRLFKKGYNYKQIGAELKCSHGLISYYCSALIEDKYSEDKINKYQEDFNKHGSVAQTAKNFKICRRTLAQHINRSEFIPIPKRKKLNSYYRQMKIKAVEYKGGRCFICGYNKCLGALDFHHINPDEKDFAISGGTKKFESIRSELDKCNLLCRNCHAEEHERLYNKINIGG